MELRRQLLKKKIQEKRLEGVGLSMPEGYAPYVGNWRNIRPETYKEFEAFIHSGKDFAGRICFPIRDRSGQNSSISIKNNNRSNTKIFI